MANYKIAVITAFHNTSFDLFERTDKSMRNQTIGFENVEWIIVMHNCDKEYIDKVTSMYKDNHNVKVKLLNNDKHTPGSPRNEAFKYVESKYITFLDSDDSFSLDCLEKVVYEMDYTNVDILRFRMEAILLQEGGVHVNIISSANATYERIICEKRDWNLDAMFSGYYGCCATEVYKFEFLKKNNLLFNEDQPVAEDILFNTMALVRADKVCILPQYIGYQYYQNEKSACRTDDRTDEDIIEMAYGFKKIFKELTDNGADITFYCYGLIAIILCAKILRSTKVTKEGRIKVKEILGEYVINMPLLPKNKYYDIETTYELYNRAKTTILFPETPTINILNNKLNGFFTLTSIINNNINTDYGKRYHFANFKNVYAFVNQVPLSDEKIYKPLTDLMYRVAEKNIILEKSIDSYIKTDKFLFPATNDFIVDIVKVMAKKLSGHYSYFIGRCNDSGLIGADNVYIDSLVSLLLKSYSSYKVFTINDKVIKNINGPSFLHRYFGERDVYDNLLIDALIDKNVDQIASFNSELILMTFEKFESNYFEYISKCKCSDERKEELIKICKSGFNGIAKKIWPKLERVIGFGCGKYKDSYEKIKKYFEGVNYNHGEYITEMGVLGIAVEDNNDIFEIHRDRYFIELLDMDTKDESTVFLTESIVGKKYEMIITNENGLYRYKSNVIITPVEVKETSFKFKFV